jgi:XTP/dITP diphosphohydrolase
MELVLATGNPQKTWEFHQLLGDSFEVTDLSSTPDITMPEETGGTFEQNAILKAVHVSRATVGVVIADDSGLEVDALGGAPGIYSARYAGENTNDAANIDKLVRELRNVSNRSARFRCAIAIARAGKLLATVEDVVEGTIVDPPRGTAGFGYDPVFQPIGLDKTFAEMPAELKNRISHRAKAAATLREKLREISN